MNMGDLTLEPDELDDDTVQSDNDDALHKVNPYLTATQDVPSSIVLPLFCCY